MHIDKSGEDSAEFWETFLSGLGQISTLVFSIDLISLKPGEKTEHNSRWTCCYGSSESVRDRTSASDEHNWVAEDGLSECHFGLATFRKSK